MSSQPSRWTLGRIIDDASFMNSTPHSPSRETLPDQKDADPVAHGQKTAAYQSLADQSREDFEAYRGSYRSARCMHLLLVLLNGLSRGLDYRGVTQALRATPHRVIWISILLTGLSYLALVARDLCALRYVGVQVSTPALLLASFCGSALGNAVSFKALTADVWPRRAQHCGSCCRMDKSISSASRQFFLRRPRSV
jgi:hypothetical protein